MQQNLDEINNKPRHLQDIIDFDNSIPTSTKLYGNLGPVIGRTAFASGLGALGGAFLPEGSGAVNGAIRGAALGVGSSLGGRLGNIAGRAIQPDGITGRAVGSILGSAGLGLGGYLLAKKLTKTKKEKLRDTVNSIKNEDLEKVAHLVLRTIIPL